MGVYIKNWSFADWKELLKWAKIGANNAMIGEFAEVEEIPPHGDLIDRDALMRQKGDCYDSDGHLLYAVGTGNILCAPSIIPAEEGET